MVDRQAQNAEWLVREADGTLPTWERAAIAVLMDIRRELRRLNAAISCQNFQAIPGHLRGIRRNTAPLAARRSARREKRA